MYRYVQVYICICAGVHMYICRCVYTICICAGVYMYMCGCIYVYVQVYICICIGVYMSMCGCIYVYVQVYVSIYMCTIYVDFYKRDNQ